MGGAPGTPLGGLISGVPICPYIIFRGAPRMPKVGGLCGASGVATGASTRFQLGTLDHMQRGGITIAITQT